MNYSKPLKALLVKKVDDKLQIFGPKTAKEISGWDDVDLVLVLSDYKEMTKPEHAQELKAFEACTDKSKVAEEAQRLIKHVRPISYMIGSVLLEDIKNFTFDGLEYKE